LFCLFSIPKIEIQIFVLKRDLIYSLIFFLLSFSLDEKETIPQGGTRQKYASTLKANAGPHFCRAYANQITNLFFLNYYFGNLWKR